MNHLLDHLNPAQREAVVHLGSPLMIIAGAGTGKTRVITHRLAFLHRECGIPLREIMAVTFTNKAAREMRERVCRLLGLPDTPGLPIGTFHSRCALILRREHPTAALDPNFAILDENDQKQAIKRVLKDMDINEKRAPVGRIQSFINQAKMRLLTPADCREEFDEDEIPYPDIYARYQETIEKNKSIDFEDLLMKTVLLLQDNEEVRRRWADRYRYVMVDEYQDTNHAQFLLTKLLAQDHEQVCVVGDEDQSIYSWRGAEISNLLDFEKTFPGTRIVKLEQNYRSTGNILRAASTVIARNTQRIGKTLFTSQDDGALLTFTPSANQDDEGQFIARECTYLIQQEGVSPDEIAIFYRGHWLSRAVEDNLRRFRLPYRVVGGIRFYDRLEIKDLLSFLRLAVNPEDDLAFERVINRPTRGVGAKTLSEILQAAARERRSLLAATGGLLESGAIKGKARRGLQKFLQSVYTWHDMAATATPADILEAILADTNYAEEGVGDPGSIEGEARIENIEEFHGMLREFRPSGDSAHLAEFLNVMALDATDNRDDASPKVSLLTIHNAKGLEFDYVFLIGLEKGAFPTRRAEESFEEFAIEEERRLFYVGLTRARRKLYLHYSAQRNRPDFWEVTSPSLFLSELPPEVFDGESLKQLRRLLPYGWGTAEGIGGSRPEAAPAEGELEYVMDEDAGFHPQERPAGTYARLTRGGGSAPSAGRPGRHRLSPGIRVAHRYMGNGTVKALSGRPGWERVEVAFDDGRTQDFVVKYAPLTPLAD